MEETVKILNYTPSVVGVPRSRAQGDGVAIAAAVDGVPGFEYFTMREVEYINSVSPVFKTGVLEFEEDVREAMYQKLGLRDWKETCLFERDIRDMILRPEFDTAQRIVDIRDAMTIERFRGAMYRLIAEGEDVSVKVQTIIETRYEEIKHGKVNSAIEVNKVQGEHEKAQQKQDEMAQLRAQIDALTKLVQQQMTGQVVAAVPHADGNILTATTPTVSTNVTMPVAETVQPVARQNNGQRKPYKPRGRKPAEKK